MSLIQPIQIGGVTLPSNLVQGPLAGYSSAPFRVLTTRYGQPGYCTTEMISAKDLVHRRKIPKRYVGRDPEEGMLCYQFAANDEDILARATQLATQYGADMVDLNCGCPVPKIRAKQTGSKLLTDPEKIHALVKAMRNHTDALVSIKIRVAAEIKDHDDYAVVDAAEQAGVDFITVHGRHWTERYDKPCRHDEIAAIVKAAKVPVFANGDVEDAASLKRIMTATRCAGVMIARASVGQPWLFQQIRAELAGETFIKPTLAEIAAVLREHIQRLVDLDSEKLALLQARKLAKYYARELPRPREFIIAMQQTSSRAEVDALIAAAFEKTEQE